MLKKMEERTRMQEDDSSEWTRTENESVKRVEILAEIMMIIDEKSMYPECKIVYIFPELYIRYLWERPVGRAITSRMVIARWILKKKNNKLDGIN